MRHWAFLPGLVALPVAIYLTWAAEPLAPPRPLFHGIARADRATVARLRDVWKTGSPNLIDKDRAREAALRSRALAIGEPASRALLQILAEHYETANMDSWSQADRDEEREPEGILIGELASEGTARGLVLAVADRRFARGLRRAIIVALCRPRFPFAAEPLAALAADRREDPEIREGILCRFHRLGLPPPASLREILYEPYHGVDILAAATLAICGDAEAPSLVLDGLRMERWNDDEQFLAHCAEAARRITKKPLGFEHSYVTTGFASTEAASLARVKPHIAALEEWIAEHAAESEFERARRDYLASEDRRRQMAVRSVADVLKAGEDLDIAAVSLWLTMDSPEEVLASLERLHRLTRLCERRLTGARAPAGKLEILNGLLGQLPVEERHEPRWGSRLSGVLANDYGNCLARSTLYLGVAERLGLPLRPYVLPEHVYVAWEEEGFLRAIETTDRGADRPRDGAPVSRRGLLSIHLSNRAATLFETESYAQVLSCAEGALALDRSNPAALCARALATWQTDLDADPRRDLDRAAGIAPGDPNYWLASSEMAWKLGFGEDALRRAEEAFRIEPSPEAKAMQARAYMTLGDTALARETADAAAQRWPRAGGALAFVRFELALEGSLERTDISPLWKARALLGRGSPDLALVRLDAARDVVLGERRTRFLDGTIYAVDQGARARERREFRLLEARALAALGREEEAREALRAAEEAAPAVRETLEVRRLLDGR